MYIILVSWRNGKCALEISRDFLKDQELSDSIVKLQNALYELNKASEIVVMTLNKLGVQE